MGSGFLFIATSASPTPDPAAVAGGGLSALLFMLLMAIFFLSGVAVYFIPTIAAIGNKHPQKVPIFILNFFAGWTVLGWVGGLVWAFVRPQSSVQVVHHYHGATPNPPLPPAPPEEQ